MKFLDMISRKRSQDLEHDMHEDQADPAPFDQVLKAAAEDTGDKSATDGAEILEYPEEAALSRDAAADDSDERGFLDDDGSYDWDLSDLASEDASDAGEPVEAAMEEASSPVAEQPKTVLEDAVDETGTMTDGEGVTAGDQGDALSADANDAVRTDDAPETDLDSAWDDDDFADDAFEDEMIDEAPKEVAADLAREDDQAPTQIKEDKAAEPAAESAGEEDFSLSSVTAALRAQMPEAPSEPNEGRAPARSSQEALLATIRAARQKAELARAESDAAPAAQPAPVSEDPVEEPAPITEQPGFKSLHPDLSDEMDDRGDDTFEAAADDDAYDAPEAEDAAHSSADSAADWAAEEVDSLPEPAPAAGRKIWEMDADDEDEDEAWLAVDPKLAAAAAEMSAPEEDPAPAAEAPHAPAGAPVDPGVAMAAMTAPKRRAGRVKTRLLGFNKPAQTDPITQAMENEVTQADEPTFPVGWLVVIRGPGRGASFALGAGASKIGRGEDQPVRLDFGDNSISRDNHAVVAYDDESRKFYLGHGGKANLVRLNDMPVLSTETLGDGDLIRIGETMLRFVALCGPDFTWAEDDTGAAPNAAAE